jgi:hypothetical protein
MQQLRSHVPSALQAELVEGALQLQLLTLMKIHGLQHRLHQPVADGDQLHQQPTNHLSNNRKVIIRNYTIPT